MIWRDRVRHRTRQRLHLRLPRHLQPECHRRGRPHRQGARLRGGTLHCRGDLQQGRARHDRLRARSAAHPASTAPDRCERLGRVRAHHLGRGAGRDPCANQRGDRALGATGCVAAELCGPARHARRRQHVVAVLLPAGRDAALSPVDVRRRAQRGLGRHLWRGSRLPAGARRRGEAERGVGQQRDRHQPASGAPHPPIEAQRRAAGGGGSAAHQDRRAGRPASGAAARHGRAAGLGAGGGAGTDGRARRCVHRAAHAGVRRVHGGGASLDGRSRGGGLRAARGTHRHIRPVAGRGGSAGVRAGQRAGAWPQRRQLDPCADCAAGPVGQAGPAAAASYSAPATRFPRRWRGCSGPISRRRACAR